LTTFKVKISMGEAHIAVMIDGAPVGVEEEGGVGLEVGVDVQVMAVAVGPGEMEVLGKIGPHAGETEDLDVIRPLVNSIERIVLSCVRRDNV
jgi:hypothetical protein